MSSSIWSMTGSSILRIPSGRMGILKKDKAGRTEHHDDGAGVVKERGGNRAQGAGRAAVDRRGVEEEAEPDIHLDERQHPARETNEEGEFGHLVMG